MNSIVAAARGDRKRLVALAQTLDDADTARDSLRAAGYGEEEDTLLAMVASVLEGGTGGHKGD